MIQAVIKRFTIISSTYFLWIISPCLADVTPFTFTSGYFTGVFQDNLKISIQGFNGATMLDSTTIVVRSTTPTLENFNWTDLTKVTFDSGGTHFALDNLVINSTTVINFDDIDAPYLSCCGATFDGYNGLDWSNFYVENSMDRDDGYNIATISPPNVAYNGSGAPANFSSIGSATGDPHFTTFDGVHYDYQGLGDFLLARSTVDQFEVQIRTTESFWNGPVPVSFITEAAATLCNHNVTFDVDRGGAGGGFVWSDGSPTSLSIASPVLALGACKIVELSPDHYQVFWNTGEMLDVTSNFAQQGGMSAYYLDLSSQLSWIDGLGSIEGLLSSDLNPDAWRVSAAASLLDSIPEPGSFTLLGIALAGLGIIRRRSISFVAFRKPVLRNGFRSGSRRDAILAA